MRKGKLLLTMLATFLIAACSKGIEGTYTAELAQGGMFTLKQTYVFDGDGKVIVSYMGTNQELDYTVDGDKIRIESPNGTVILMRQEDGSLAGPMRTRLIKQGDKKNEERLTKPQPNKTATSVNGDEPDLSLPLSQYLKVPATDAAFLTKLVVAMATPPFGDEEKLDLLSANYYNEKDGFKKRDIAKAELPAINAKLNRLKNMHYISIPLQVHEAEYPIKLDPLNLALWLDSYDFASKSFPIIGSASQQDCFAWHAFNNQGVGLQTSNTNLPCALKITDEAMARRIEDVNKHLNLDLKGTVYLYVSERNRKMLGRVTHVRLELWNRSTNEQLGVFDL